MVTKLSNTEIGRIRQLVREEFPGDPALQQIHFARKVIAREAELSGQGYLEYVRRLSAKERRRRNKGRP